MLSYVWLLLISVSPIVLQMVMPFSSLGEQTVDAWVIQADLLSRPSAPNSCQAGHQHPKAMTPFPFSEHLGERRWKMKAWGGAHLLTHAHIPLHWTLLQGLLHLGPFLRGPSWPPQPLVHFLCPRHLLLLGLGSLWWGWGDDLGCDQLWLIWYSQLLAQSRGLGEQKGSVAGLLKAQILALLFPSCVTHYLPSLCLSLPGCKMEMMIIPTWFINLLKDSVSKCTRIQNTCSWGCNKCQQWLKSREALKTLSRKNRSQRRKTQATETDSRRSTSAYLRARAWISNQKTTHEAKSHRPRWFHGWVHCKHLKN